MTEFINCNRVSKKPLTGTITPKNDRRELIQAAKDIGGENHVRSI
jgi:hypothetical protein